MGEIRITVPTGETSHWPKYMSDLLQEVVRSWVDVVESGEGAAFIRIRETHPATTEHLRIAKSFLRDFTPEPRVVVENSFGEFDLDELKGWDSV